MIPFWSCSVNSKLIIAQRYCSFWIHFSISHVFPFFLIFICSNARHNNKVVNNSVEKWEYLLHSTLLVSFWSVHHMMMVLKRKLCCRIRNVAWSVNFKQQLHRMQQENKKDFHFLFADSSLKNIIKWPEKLRPNSCLADVCLQWLYTLLQTGE